MKNEKQYKYIITFNLDQPGNEKELIHGRDVLLHHFKNEFDNERILEKNFNFVKDFSIKAEIK